MEEMLNTTNKVVDEVAVKRSTSDLKNRRVAKNKAANRGYTKNWWIVISKHYADFDGSVSRWEFWAWILVNMFINMGLFFFALFGPITYLIVSGVVSIALFVPSLAMIVRRMHDIGKSGWQLLLFLIPLIGPIWLIVLCCKKGNSVKAGRWRRGDFIVAVVSPLLFIVGVALSGSESMNTDRAIVASYYGQQYEVYQMPNVVNIDGCTISNFDIKEYGGLETVVTDMSSPFCVLKSFDPTSPYIDDERQFVGYMCNDGTIKVLVDAGNVSIRIYSADGNEGVFAVHENGEEFDKCYIYDLTSLIWEREPSMDRLVRR